MEINEIYEAIVLNNDFEGNGIVKINDFTIFIPYALKDETIKFKVTKLNKNYGFGKLLEISKQSPFRVEPMCKMYSECGGCNLMHLKYDMHKEYKINAVKDLIKRIGKIDVEIKDLITMDYPFNYRNNVQVSFSKTNDIIHAGFYLEETHTVIDIDNCLITNNISIEIIKELKNIFLNNNISIYNEKTKKGCIKQVMIRNNNIDEFMVIIITNTPYLEKKDIIIKELTNKFNNIVSIIHNINDNPKFHLGLKSNVLYGLKAIKTNLFDTIFEIDPHSFYQVNNIQVEKLYSKVFEYLNLKDTDTLIDAYCGIGTMSLILSKKCKYVYGIEVVKEAIANANNNKINNNIHNASFILGKAEDEIKHLVKNNNIDALIVDPPRKGCDKAFLESIIGIEKIVYVSCNPATLARDLEYLKQYYDINEITLVDMFPFSNHTETVCLLDIKSAK